MTTTDTRVSPVIDMESADFKLTHNVIDAADEEVTDAYLSIAGDDNVIPIKEDQYIGENDIEGGVNAAKHICIPINLIEPSVGLSIKLSANRPPDTGIGVYYRTCTKDQNIRNREWEYIAPVNQMPADTNRNTFREYQYLVGGEGGYIPPFDKFQIKITFASTTSAKVPVIKSLRAIALAD